ncbi:replication endonuclease [Chitinivorax sp. PXF-14]|uniref:replication endonuclease n=1 Tax=Chitinivorax sp. PXF-14 TaxID=3230488 RepID=UPI003466DB1A
MNNYKEEKSKIKSLREYLLNKFSWTVKESEFKLAEVKKTFKNKAEEHLSKRINEAKLSFIPVDLKDEVLWYVKNQFKGDLTSYLMSVDLYFKTFNLENLSKCNIKESEIYEQASTKGRQKLNRERKHNLFHASVLLKLTGKKKAKYTCNTIFNEFKQAKKKEFEFIKNSKVVSADKKVLSLADCVKTSEQSVAEKLNLLNVQERLAEEKGWTWCFITLTLPGEYHPNPLKGKNTYNGVSPRESAKLLNENIKRVRSLLAKRGIKAGRDYHGCSSAEAHKDGVLHKHMLFFCSPELVEQLREAFQFTFNNMNEGSFRVNNGQAKASSYVFKYVMKSITSFDNSIDLEKVSKEDKNAILNNAFRSYNFIRGFSFFGIENCLTKFRFIARNLKDMNLPEQVAILVKENNLFELLVQGIFDMFENVYAVNEDGLRIFSGCKFKGKLFMKKFFSLVRNALEVKEERKDIYSKVALKRKEEICSLLGLVILNHNYSRKDREAAFLEEQSYFDWLFERMPLNFSR